MLTASVYGSSGPRPLRHKKLVIVIILDKLAFANKEADSLIWSLKGRKDRGDHHQTAALMKHFITDTFLG